MYDKLPKKIKVGHKDYKVVVCAKQSRADMFGECNHVTSEISLAQDLPKHELANTLYHEVLHAAFWTFNFPNGRGDDRINHITEERMVTSVANAMMCVYRDNPDLLHFIGCCLADKAILNGGFITMEETK